jgi:AraC-like DNA-binding protein
METTPKKLIKKLKLEKAKKLAEETCLTINQILDEVEAGDPKHFRQAFKTTFGMTLSECRGHSRQANASPDDGNILDTE